MDHQLRKIPSPSPSPRGRGNKFFFLSLRERMKVRVFRTNGKRLDLQRDNSVRGEALEP